MALGIDIYRYQTVTDWDAVKRHGVSFVYVKGTDGGGPAIVRATSQVRGAQGVGIPVGLYHYAELSPSPEAQADVLTAEVRRLGATGLPPALDLEDPHKPGPAARDFALRFIARMRNNGFPRVTLYANTSMLTGIGGPDIDDDPDIVIWAASYGPNDGRRHPLNYRGRVDIHQYTSVGRVPGISGQVDLNESLIDQEIEDGMELGDSMRAFIWPHDDTIEETVGSTLANGWSYSKTLSTVQLPQLVERMAQLETKIDAGFAGLSDDETNVISEIRKNGLGDPDAFAGILAPLLGPLVQAGASEEQVRAQADAAISAAFAKAAGNGGDSDG